MKKRNPMTVFSVVSASQSPCYGCHDRYALCHTECGKYKAWRAELGDKKKHEKQENAYSSYQHEKISEKERVMVKGSNTYKRHYGRKL